MAAINDKRTIKAWAMFDWANSAYNLVITSTIFPAYYTAITQTPEHGDKVLFFGREYVNTALSNYALAVAYLTIALISPLLTSIADYRGNKRIFMIIFTILGSVACGGLFFFKLETLEWGIICFALAAIGYSGGIVFNNSYLPEIASPDRQDQVSAKGFAFGYIGSVILQLICLLFVLKPGWFGIVDGSYPARLSFLLVGIWWIGFAIIPFTVLPKGSPNFKMLDRRKIHSGFEELLKVSQKLRSMPQLKRFLPAYFFYAMGVHTIMLVAANFGGKVLQLSTGKLIVTVLIIQIEAIVGAYLMSYGAKKVGNVKILISVMVVWIGVCIAAFFIHTEMQFYILAAVVGLIMGGVQAVSRSTYSKFLPGDIPDNTAFFSFYDVTEKIAIVGGLLSFGLIEELTGDMRYSALFLSVYFFIGMVLLFHLLSYQSGIKRAM